MKADSICVSVHNGLGSNRFTLELRHLRCVCNIKLRCKEVRTQQLELFHQPTLMHSFLYSLTIRLLHYYPRHVSNINMPIFRRKNCIHTASGIFALCKRLHSTLVESGLFHFYVGKSWCYLPYSAFFVIPDCWVVLVQFHQS